VNKENRHRSSSDNAWIVKGAILQFLEGQKRSWLLQFDCVGVLQSHRVCNFRKGIGLTLWG
jgi:hypothetical protein